MNRSALLILLTILCGCANVHPSPTLESLVEHALGPPYVAGPDNVVIAFSQDIPDDVRAAIIRSGRQTTDQQFLPAAEYGTNTRLLLIETFAISGRDADFSLWWEPPSPCGPRGKFSANWNRPEGWVSSPGMWRVC